MGCGQSKGLPIFTKTKPKSIVEVARDDMVGSAVHVVGFVKPASQLLLLVCVHVPMLMPSACAHTHGHAL